MPDRPELIDNLTQSSSHAEALRFLIKDFPATHELSIASGYVNLGGLRELSATVTDRGARLLLGAAPDPGLDADLPLSRFEIALLNLRKDRDLARFPPSRAAAALASVQAWLSRPDVAVRRYVTEFLHGKAYLFGDKSDA